MMYKHYIRVNDAALIIDGFSTFDRQPEEGDILLRSDGGETFDILGDGFWRPLWFIPPIFPELKIYEYAWTGEAVRARTNGELEADIPPLPVMPTIEERLNTAEYNIETLDRVIIIMMGGDPDV